MMMDVAQKSQPPVILKGFSHSKLWFQAPFNPGRDVFHHSASQITLTNSRLSVEVGRIVMFSTPRPLSESVLSPAQPLDHVDGRDEPD